MTLRAAASITLFTLLPVVSASAQFTTYVAPPAPRVDSVSAVAADSGRLPRDTNRVAITNMKAWVDSAAGQVAGRHLTSTEVAPGTAGATGAAGTTRTTTRSFREGSTAPDTATPLPTLALFGTSALAVGLLLLRRKRA